MNFSEPFIRRPVMTLLLTVTTVIFGALAYRALPVNDLPTVEGTVIIAAFFIIFLNLIVDIIYAFLDPRVRY